MTGSSEVPVAVAFILGCATVVGMLIVVCKVVAAWNRFVGQLRSGADAEPVLRADHPGAGIIRYRTRNGRTDYGFRIVRVADGAYRVYIVEQPSYGSRDTSSHATHRLRDEHGDYVCWTSRLETREQARQVAALWADSTEEYILHGRSF